MNVSVISQWLKEQDLLIAALNQNDEVVIQAITIDSRNIPPNALFIALAGERFDGHDFIPEAEARGALAVITEHLIPDCSLPQLQVKSSLKALKALALGHRKTIHCPIIAVTGSNGKTTVKEMIASILPKPSHATMGNLNNHIGAPLSVLQLTPAHRYAVFELGASHSGDIEYTASIVKPDVALINNIAPAHIGVFGSIEAVAKTKGEIYEALSPEGVAIINQDDAFSNFWAATVAKKRRLGFSLSQPSDITAQSVTYDAKGCARFRLILPDASAMVSLQIPGEHSLRNALAAAACTHAVGIDIQTIVSGLEAFLGVKGRMTFIKGKKNACVIDDSYNANLQSVLTAVEVLARHPGQRILVLGDMGELGDYAKAHHEEIGRFAQQKGIDAVFTCGNHSAFTSEAFGEKATHYKNKEALAQDLLQKLDEHTTVLIKGSRSAAMEQVVHQIVAP